LFEIEMKGINALVVETYRALERQYYLYCKGRTVEEAIRKGVPKSKAEKYVAQLKAENYKGGKVTWALNSIHIQKQAIDVVPQRKVNGKMTAIWNSSDPQTKKIISIMSKYGFEAGANWTNSVDSPHFQIKGNLSSLVSKTSTTFYLTKAIQTALKNALDVDIAIDGKWGKGTDGFVIAFRKKMGYKTFPPTLGKEALKTLLSYLL